MIALVFQLTELKNCYDDEIEAEYNENLKQIVLTLSPNIESKCDLSDEVQLEITFYADILPLKYVEDKFSFTTTKRIVLENVEILDSTSMYKQPITSYLNISTLYSYYYAEIAIFGEETSQFDECFDESKSFFSPMINSYFFELYLTTACEEEIRQAETYQLTFGSESRNVINDNSVCTFDSQTRIYRCEEQVDYQEELQVPFSAARLVFNIEILGIQYTSEITFSDVRKGTISDLVRDAKLYVFENNIFVNGSINTEQEERLLGIVLDNYDTVIYRLNIENMSSQSHLSISSEKETYTEQSSMFEFLCSDDNCFESLKIITYDMRNYNFDMDITFVKDGKVVLFVQINLERTDSCIFKVVAEVVNPHYECSYLYIKNSEACRPVRAETTVTTQIVTPNRGEEPVVQEFVQKFDFSSTRYCFDCGGECYGHGDPNAGILVFYEQEKKGFSLGYIVSSSMRNYRTTQITIYVIGIAIIAFCLVDTVIKCVVMAKLIKASKQKKHSA